MRALDTQVGGGHYKDLNVQPVEFWHANLMGASEGACLKYVTRWRSKEGLKDLRKARHFLMLILQDEPYIRLFMQQRRAFPWYRGMGVHADDYIAQNGIDRCEAGVIRHVYDWHVSAIAGDLKGALKWIDELIEKAVAEGWEDDSK